MRGALEVAALGVLMAGPTAPSTEGDVPGAGSSGDSLAVTLEQAESMALEGNAGLGALRQRALAADARARGAASVLWPSLGAEAGYVRSDDPVAAFGTRLRQGRFAEADFALDRLNDPTALDDWSVGVGVRWAGADPSAWAARDAGTAAARARALQAEWGEEHVLFRTRVLFWDAVGAEARLESTRLSEVSARATLDLVERRRSEGILTDADVLQARAALAGARADRVRAGQGVADSRSRLALHLGVEGQVLPVADGAEGLPVTSPEPGPGRSAEAVDVDDARADLRASREGLAAASAESRRARAARLPRAELFARLDTHAPRPLDGVQEFLTVGVTVSVPLFTAGGTEALRDEAVAQERAARLEHEDRVRAAVAEVESARRAVSAATEALDASRAASRSADEARRLLRRRFEEGLTTTADLLRAEAVAGVLRTRAVDAEVAVRQALAALDFALGDRSPSIAP